MKQITPEQPSTRVAIFVKGNGCGVLRLDVGTGGTLLSLNDNGTESASPCQTPPIGRELFLRSMARSIDNGYRVGFLGTPNNAPNS